MALTAKPRLMKEEIGEEAEVRNQTKYLTKPLKIFFLAFMNKKINT